MGHDIQAYRKAAYLRRNAFSASKGLLYTVLKADDLNGGVSGVGSRMFSEKEIMEAIDTYRILPRADKEGNEDIEDFLLSALTVATAEGWVLIDFS